MIWGKVQLRKIHFNAQSLPYFSLSAILYRKQEIDKTAIRNNPE